jgi:hypothetical protein
LGTGARCSARFFQNPLLSPEFIIFFDMSPNAPQSPIDVVLAGLRTDADLLRRLLALLPEEERGVRETVLREIDSKIVELESMVRVENPN